MRYFGQIIIAVWCLLMQLGSGQSVHRVKEGESLWLIAKRAGISVESLKAANGMTSDVVWEGAQLIIPARGREVALEPTPPAESSRASLPEIAAPVPQKKKARAGISEKGREILQLQVTLDRAGFSPGVIDGYDGNFTRLAKKLCTTWNPQALQANLAPTRVVTMPTGWEGYVNTALPGTGARPDFKALTSKKRVIRYYSALEYLAERFHCSEALLKKLNPKVSFQAPAAGTRLVVPNVEPFEIERYFSSEGKGVWSAGLGKGKSGRRVVISAHDAMLTLWEGERLIRAYPITLNEEDSPRGQREIGSITPGPHYMRKKTGLNLMPGPNSPVGIMWCPLGNGFGIHGTSNPASIGRSVSSGCVRLANWDAVRFAALVSKGTEVFISQRERTYRGD